MSRYEEFDTSNYQVICNKQNMCLKVDKEDNIYMLDWEMQNTNKFNIDELMTFKIYNLIEKINQEMIEKIEILRTISDNEIDILFIFKGIGTAVGIRKKYMVIKTYRIKTKDLIIFKSVNLEENINHIQIENAERIKCNFANLIIIPSANKLKLNYKFNIDINEDLPIYMEHLMGLMMKKIFYNLKIFIENKKN